MTAILAVGNASVASGSKPGPAMAYRPAPYAFRTTTQIFGTVASATALIIFAPCLMIPCFSTAAPTMKPGTSARKRSGTLNASPSWGERRIEGVGELDEAGGLVGAVDEEYAGAVHGVVRRHADDLAVETAETDHHPAGPPPLDLE